MQKDHAMTRYSIDELETEFKSLTREEAKEIIGLAVKEREIWNVRLLMHIAICMANDVGAHRSVPISRSSILVVGILQSL